VARNSEARHEVDRNGRMAAGAMAAEERLSHRGKNVALARRQTRRGQRLRWIARRNVAIAKRGLEPPPIRNVDDLDLKFARLGSR